MLAAPAHQSSPSAAPHAAAAAPALPPGAAADASSPEGAACAAAFFTYESSSRVRGRIGVRALRGALHAAGLPLQGVGAQRILAEVRARTRTIRSVCLLSAAHAALRRSVRASTPACALPLLARVATGRRALTTCGTARAPAPARRRRARSARGTAASISPPFRGSQPGCAPPPDCLSPDCLTKGEVTMPAVRCACLDWTLTAESWPQ